MKDVIREALAFTDLTPEEKEKRGILGRLYGPIADVVRPTRNGRKYSEELWEKVFTENTVIKELLANGGIPGELDHPKDRDDVLPEKIAIMMPEAPKKDSSGKLIGYFDILDTPLGKIAYQLAKYGFKLGISSRGNGDVEPDDYGEGESVVPDSYDFKCFDLVLTPSVEGARMTMVESLDTNMLNLKKALTESLNTANAEDKKVMKETLENLNIEIESKEGPNSEKSEDIVAESEDSQTNSDKPEEANNDGSVELIKSLQEALESKSNLEAKVKSLQEQLAVSDTKVKKLDEECSKLKSATTRLSTIAYKSKGLPEKVSTLEEELKVKNQTIESQKSEIQRLNESKKSEDSKTTLNESISNKEKEIANLNESLNKQKEEFESKIKQLNESLENERTDSSKQKDELSQKLHKAINLKESYKKLANQAVDKYIVIRADMLGVKPIEIKNKLSESYNFEDIDKVCEDLQEYELNMQKLPFSLDRKVRVQVTESRNDPLKLHNPDDDIDESFLDSISLK